MRELGRLIYLDTFRSSASLSFIHKGYSLLREVLGRNEKAPQRVNVRGLTDFRGVDTATIRERILSKVEYSDTDCWVFTGAKTSRGYGSLRVNGESRSTHVLMYEEVHGTVPDDLELDHLCRVRACCNPQHLEAVVQLTNWERGESPTRLNSLRTHCVNGHELYGDNLIKRLDGHRQCAACHRTTNREHMRSTRKPRGYVSKLTADMADQIRSMHATGEHTQRSIAGHFGVSPTLVSLVLSGKRHAA